MSYWLGISYALKTRFKHVIIFILLLNWMNHNVDLFLRRYFSSKIKLLYRDQSIEYQHSLSLIAISIGIIVWSCKIKNFFFLVLKISWSCCPDRFFCQYENEVLIDEMWKNGVFFWGFWWAVKELEGKKFKYFLR